MVTKFKDYIKSNKTILFKVLIMTVVFVLILIVNLHTTYTSDDFMYTFKFETGRPSDGVSKIRSIDDLIESMSNHRKLWNGRIVSHSILQIVMLFGEKFVRVFNSLMFVLCGGLIYKHSYYGRNKEQPLALAFIYILMWFSVPFFGRTIVWASGAANYLWLCDLILLFLLPFRMYAVNDSSVKNSIKNLILMVFFGLLAGCTNENTCGGVLLMCVGFIILYKIKGFRIPVWSWASVISVIFGMIFLLTAPANKIRASKPLTFTAVLNNLKDITSVTKELSFWLLLLMVIFLMLSRFRRTNSDNNSEKYNYLIPSGYAAVSAAMIAALMFAPQHPLRGWFTSIIFLIIVVVWQIPNIDLKIFSGKAQKAIYISSILFALGLFSFSYGVELKNINSSYIQAKNALTMIEEAAREGKVNVTVPLVKATKSKYDIYSGGYFLSKSANVFTNKWAAEYYGVKTVSGKK